jgi:AraC-like DNA-binding protein
MDVLYVEEHLSCYHYNSMADPTARYTEFLPQDEKQHVSAKNNICFVMKGTLAVSFGKILNKKVTAGDFFLLPAYTEILTKAKTTASIFSIDLPLHFSFCEHLSLDKLATEAGKRKTDKKPFLKANAHINAFLDSFFPSWQKGMRCNFYLDLKIKEFFFILRSCIHKKELVAFLAPLLSNDMEFYRMVLEKYPTIKTAKELAEATNYSVPGFDKKFKRIFGMSAHKWMTKQLADNIYHEIKCTTKSFTHISSSFGFSSPAHFSSFCKSTFHSTPKTIRLGGVCNRDDTTEKEKYLSC